MNPSDVESTVRTTLQVHYGGAAIPSLAEVCLGGQVKFQRLQPHFPDSGCHADILYLVSSSLPDQWLRTYWRAKQNGQRVVWNHSAVSYRAVWPDLNSDDDNLLLEQGLHAADYVIYQSRFCQEAADRYLGPFAGPCEVLYNAVDTRLFSPADRVGPRSECMVLLAGTQYRHSSLEIALTAFAAFRKRVQRARLLVTGSLCWNDDREAARRTAQAEIDGLGLNDAVDFLGEYTQADAPRIYGLADVLLHTRYDDLCPNVAIEAMACGVPVVYTRTGGTPELVGEEAGVGVEITHSWEEERRASPEAWADALMRVNDDRTRFAAAARQRAVERFDLGAWIARHRDVFERVVAAPAVREPHRTPVNRRLRAPLQLLTLFPDRVRQGDSFNLQPDGRSALAISAANATHATLIVVDEEPLDTAFSNPSFVSAGVASDLTDSAGTHRVRLAELLRTSDDAEFEVEPAH